MVFEAVRLDSAGRSAGSVAALAPVLGPKGWAHLDRLAADVSDAKGATQSRLRILRRAIAAARNDVDGYIALIPTSERKDPATAVDMATRLQAVDRAEDALAVLRPHPPCTGEDQIIACLHTLKHKDDLKALHWDSFTARPDADRLRAYLRLHPDFEDIDAEDTARRLTNDHPDSSATLALDWPDTDAAATVILTPVGALEKTTAAFPTYADALESRHPLAALLLRRKAIHAHLSHGMAAEDRHAASLLLANAEADARIADYGTAPDHLSFRAAAPEICQAKGVLGAGLEAGAVEYPQIPVWLIRPRCRESPKADVWHLSRQC